jgi:hypothetical protein
MFGRHLQQMVDKSRLIFDPLCIVPESLAEKTLYVGLKLLPSLIQFLLIHAHSLPFCLNKDGRLLRIFIFMLTGIVRSTFANGLPIAGKINIFELSFNNGALD